jgi:holo-[acyl-carrier protein] synthase
MNGLDIGVDIVEIERIKKLVEGDTTFLTRVYTEAERAYCDAKPHPWQHYAARFAAKEAVIKALGQKSIAFNEIEVINDGDGKPHIVLHGKWKEYEQGLLLSLSHAEHYAVAQVVYEKH